MVLLQALDASLVGQNGADLLKEHGESEETKDERLEKQEAHLQHGRRVICIVPRPLQRLARVDRYFVGSSSGEDGSGGWLHVRQGGYEPRDEQGQGEKGKQGGVAHKEDKVFLIVCANAVVDPGAVVVHFQDTSIAL